ncbi:helix-turn-helix domain-containing protein [Carnobacterium maltaromaticum]|uniref:helix-turn-helix domain-containing protein n=1 Tax=Carnobacterium maltaromaticum TaxID=2751 RepID=UPI00191BA526|nr:helix-turn-helix domain-containing protein [Carnobacterium maltaromaticum]CAD5900044.1 putative Mga helix-turn-helix domain-containing protein [Carnobacterium maltaromaticum]
MLIETILSTAQLRQVNLIRFLNFVDSASQKQILQKLKCNESTFYRDIRYLNSIIDPVEIKTDNLVKLIIPPNLNIRYIFSCILKKSPEILIIETLLFNETHSLNTLSDLIYTSQSTLRRIIKRMNTTLEYFNIKISSYPIKLIGDEKSICALLISLFEEKYTFNNYPFPQNQVDALETIFLSTLGNKNEHFNYSDLKRFKLISLVIIKRMQNGHIKIISPSNLQDIYYETILKGISKENFRSIFKLDLNSNNLNYMFYPFTNTNFIISTNHLTLLRNSEILIDKKLIMFEKLINNISIKYNLKVENIDVLLFHLYNTSEILFGSYSIIYDKTKEFVAELTLYNESFIDYLKTELKKIDLSNSWNESSYYTLSYVLITHWKNLALYLKQSVSVLKVGLFFDSDTEHLLYIMDELNEEFKYILDIQPIYALTITQLKIEIKKFDFIITNIPNLDIDSTIIAIPMYPKYSDIKKIHTLYKKLKLNLGI